MQNITDMLTVFLFCVAVCCPVWVPRLFDVPDSEPLTVTSYTYALKDSLLELEPHIAQAYINQARRVLNDAERIIKDHTNP